MKIIAGDFEKQGFALVAAPGSQLLMNSIRAKFETCFATRFGGNPACNRNIIRLFAEDIAVKRFFCSQEIVDVLTNYLKIGAAVQTGPVVTHYTANNATGNNYGLPYHQDWPSMGTSSRGVILWTSLTNIGKDGPGLRIIPGSHLRGLWPGSQTESGYVLHDQDIENYIDIEIEAGQILLMSPFLVHKTRTALNSEWKLSLSCRFDDFNCSDWGRRNFVSAYRTAVDRYVYLDTSDQLIKPQ